MKFLVYTTEPLDHNATLDSFDPRADGKISRVVNVLREMNLERVLSTDSVNLLVDNIDYDLGSGTVKADIYKQANPGRALHQFKKEGDKITIQEILSENDDAFIKGALGIRRVDEEIHMIIQNKFGSYFVYASKGLKIRSQYSSDTVQSIQESDSIGKTTLDFANDYDLTASLFRPPEDADLRDENGFGSVDTLNKLLSVMRISRSHRITLDIDRDEWLSNVDVFDQLIESGMVTTIRVEGTTNGIVKLGEGGDRAVRESITTAQTGKLAIDEAFNTLGK